MQAAESDAARMVRLPPSIRLRAFAHSVGQSYDPNQQHGGYPQQSYAPASPTGYPHQPGYSEYAPPRPAHPPFQLYGYSPNAYPGGYPQQQPITVVLQVRSCCFFKIGAT